MVADALPFVGDASFADVVAHFGVVGFTLDLPVDQAGDPLLRVG
jgi:hypothetical protein